MCSLASCLEARLLLIIMGCCGSGVGGACVMGTASNGIASSGFGGLVLTYSFTMIRSKEEPSPGEGEGEGEAERLPLMGRSPAAL